MAIAQVAVNQTAKRVADTRLSITVVEAIGSAAKMGWNTASQVSDARKSALLEVAGAELAAYLAS